MKIRNLVLSLFTIGVLWSCSKDDGPSTPNGPTVTSFTPEQGPVGTLVTVNGTNFATTAAANTVKLGSATATISGTPTATKLTITVPQGATSGKISVTVGGKTDTSTKTFTVTEPDPTNTPPVIADQGFEILESVQEIGEVVANDDDQDNLIFVIATNDNDLFVIDQNTGLLSLAEGKKLDFDTVDSHTITVQVSDGKGGVAEADITINVTKDQAPIGETAYVVEVEEIISDTDEIATIDVEDPEEQTITYSISENENDLFEIDADGQLTLAEGKNLDYENDTQHNITVVASDGFNELEISVTINVEDIITIEDPSTFVTTWLTDSDGDTIQIGLNNILEYNFTINWGDGTIELVSGSDLSSIDHLYDTQGIYRIVIQGNFPAIRMDDNGSAIKLQSVDQWGEIIWQSMENAFFGCENLKISSEDIPNTSQVTSLAYMFTECFELQDGNIGGWDVSEITNMTAMFQDATSFVGPLGDWKTGNVERMTKMFQGAIKFDRFIGNWDTSKVTHMNNMFNNAEKFNKDLGVWNIESLTHAEFMLNNSGMSQVNYNATLIGWSSQQADLQANVTVGANGLQYCGQDAIEAKDILESIGWDFVGDVGLANCP